MRDWKSWAQSHMKGVENLLMPSFAPDLENLDEEGIRWDVQKTKEHGFFSTLCTCEAGLEMEESKRFIEIVADEAGDELSVGITAMLDSFDQNRDLIEHAATVGCDTVLLGYPMNWVPDDPEEVFQRTRSLAEAADIGIILHLNDKYNFGHLHPSGYPMEILDRMADIDNAIAMEVSEPAMMGPAHRQVGDRLLLTNPIEGLIPNHVHAFDMQWFGAGPYEVYQSPDQPMLVEYFRQLREGSREDAMETYRRLAPLRETFMHQMQVPLQVGAYHWPQQKYYQWLMGGNGGYTRQPVMELTMHDRHSIRQAMRQVGLEPRENDAEFFEGRVNYEE